MISGGWRAVWISYRCRVASGLAMNSRMHWSREPAMTVYVVRSVRRSLLRDGHFRSLAGAAKFTENCPVIRSAPTPWDYFSTSPFAFSPGSASMVFAISKSAISNENSATE
jgi:hypothetical protein